MRVKGHNILLLVKQARTLMLQRVEGHNELLLVKMERNLMLRRVEEHIDRDREYDGRNFYFLMLINIAHKGSYYKIQHHKIEH